MSIKASMNKGLSKKLVTEFPDITPVLRPQVTDQVIKDPNWLVGFIDGEGCFFVNIYNSPLSKLGVVLRRVWFLVLLNIYVMSYWWEVW